MNRFHNRTENANITPMLKQQEYSDASYADPALVHAVTSDDPLTQYIISWRIRETLRRIQRHIGDGNLDAETSILFTCAGDGGEASVCANLGYSNVTFSDVSRVGVDAGLRRDPRLKGFSMDAQNLDLPDNSYDVVIIQDGLHHLSSPVQGFTEAIRVARIAAAFIEPNNSLIGKLIGKTWETNGDAVNYVFRWTKYLVQDIGSSYLGPDAFDNLSFSYWHHNIVYAKLGKIVGGGRPGLILIGLLKFVLDHAMPLRGNALTGIIIKRNNNRPN